MFNYLFLSDYSLTYILCCVSQRAKYLCLCFCIKYLYIAACSANVIHLVSYSENYCFKGNLMFLAHWILKHVLLL